MSWRKPPLATLAVLSFLVNWNDFLWPVYVLFSPENLTLPPGLSILQNAYSTDYAVVMAGGVVTSVPVLLVFIIAQKYVIQGTTAATSSSTPSRTKRIEPAPLGPYAARMGGLRDPPPGPYVPSPGGVLSTVP